MFLAKRQVAIYHRKSLNFPQFDLQISSHCSLSLVVTVNGEKSAEDVQSWNINSNVLQYRHEKPLKMRCL